MSYRADLDGIRCLAVLIVLIFHFDLLPLGHAGFMGVDIFFVLSGYLISGIIWQQLERGSFSLRTFYLRRLRRLGPVLLVVQVLALAAGALLMLPDVMLAAAKQALYTQLYVVNFFFWKSINYFGLNGARQPFLHCWSLAVEEQFYALFPLLTVAVHRWARAWWTVVLVVLALLSFGLNLLLVGSKPELTFYLLPTRAWQLLAGALVHAIEPAFSRGATRQAAGGVGVALVLASLVAYDPSVAFPGWFALLPVTATIGLILAGTGDGSLVSRVLSVRWIVYVGRISYSLYLVHWPVRVYSSLVVREYSLGLRVAGFVASFVLAAALFRLVEQPLRDRRWLPAPRRFLLAYAGLTSVTLGVMAWSIVTRGWQGRFSRHVNELVRWSRDIDEVHRKCGHKKGEALKPSCKLGAPGASPTFTVLGDSHAMALAQAFSLAFERHAVAGQLVAAHGCMPILELGTRRCMQFVRDALGDLGAAEQPENVVLVSIWRPDFEAGVMGPGEKWLVGPEAERAFHGQFEKTLRFLREAGKKPYVWMGLPASPSRVPDALARKAAFGTEWPVTQSRAVYDRDFAFLVEAVTRNETLVAGTISLAPSMCDAGVCRFVAEGRPLFHDDNHPAYSSSPFFANAIERNLGTALLGGSSRAAP